MIAVDTNILVYAHRADSPWHARAREIIAQLAHGRSPWAIPWPCISEFLAIATHPRIYNPPTPLADAVRQVRFWLASPSLALLAETPGYFDEFAAVIVQSSVCGAAVHDARVAALCLHHGVRALYTADRDFTRFARLRTENPLISA